MRNLPCRRLQCDEIWAFCYAKDKNVSEAMRATPGVGSIWTWTAICADTKLMPAFHIGTRDAGCAWEFMRNLAWHRPDLLFWTGDQVYEAVGGFGTMETRDPELLVPSMLDYLRKWYIFGWAARDLLRDIPSVCMTDDHDMFHGNIWGCGGKTTDPNLPLTGEAGQDSGGYKMPARWVNMAQRAQTSHLPAPFDPMMQVTSPLFTRNETPHRTWVAP